MIYSFPDRRDRLFGREPDIHRLIDRAGQTGLTALVARPMMGKTWALEEVARRLLEEGRFLVGYHESKGSETSHLLYAVSNLYTRWLADSTMRDQALSLWQRHKETLVPRVGQMVGLLFDKLAGKQLPEGIGAAVRSAFDGLAEAQGDLLTGGLRLAPLPYDQAQSLVALVAGISARRVVLILDAWEKSPSLRAEHATLESVLKHREDWASTHVLVAIRDPQQATGGKAADEALEHAENLCQLSANAVIQRLEASISVDVRESRRMLDHIRSHVAAASGEPDETLLRWVDGYPGVLDRWTSAASAAVPLTSADLPRIATEAQALRYTDLHQLLSGLNDGRLTLAARLACFPRLDAESWEVHKSILLKDQDEASVDVLVDASVLDLHEAFPSYGHDTRHAAARRWFGKHKLPLLRRSAADLIRSLAAVITDVDAVNRPYLEALAAFADVALEVGVDPTAGCFVDAARTAFGEFDPVLAEPFERSYLEAVRRTPAAASLIALALVTRGSVKDDQRGDSEGAIADFTAAIKLPGAPAAEVKRALLGRCIAHYELGAFDAATADWHAAHTAAVELPGVPADEVAKALIYRAVVKGQRGDSNAEIADYTAAIELPGAPADEVAIALINRGVAKGQRGDSAAEIADYTAAIELPGAPIRQVAIALLNRGVANGRRGDSDAEIADYTAAIKLPGAPADVVEAAGNALNRLSSPGSSDT
jgi:tetratricopeptide (TPR) repeat protein